ncbi:MAG: hypothetical protein ACJ71S_06405 [Acidobacteriaceae bacterium]|jgi:hypothetical protein
MSRTVAQRLAGRCCQFIYFSDGIVHPSRRRERKGWAIRWRAAGHLMDAQRRNLNPETPGWLWRGDDKAVQFLMFGESCLDTLPNEFISEEVGA